MGHNNEKLKGLDNYCREINIDLWGGNNVIDAFDKFLELSYFLGLSKISFSFNDRKITIEKTKMGV